MNQIQTAAAAARRDLRVAIAAGGEMAHRLPALEAAAEEAEARLLEWHLGSLRERATIAWRQVVPSAVTASRWPRYRAQLVAIALQA